MKKDLIGSDRGFKGRTFLQNGSGHDDVDFSQPEIFDGLVQLGLLFTGLLKEASARQAAEGEGGAVGVAATDTRNGGLVDQEGQGGSDLTFLHEDDGAGIEGLLEVGGLEEVEKELDLAGGEGLKLDIVRYPDGVKTHSEKSAKELIIILDSVHRLDFYRDRFFSESLPFSLRGIYKKKSWTLLYRQIAHRFLLC